VCIIQGTGIGYKYPLTLVALVSGTTKTKYAFDLLKTKTGYKTLMSKPAFI